MRPLLLTLALALACGPSKSNATDDATTTDGDSTTDAPTGGFACEGPLSSDIACVEPGETRALWNVSPAHNPEDADEPCTVTAVYPGVTHHMISLECPGHEHDLEMTTSAPHVELAIETGAAVRLQYVLIPNGEVPSAYFMLRDGNDDSLLAAGISGPTTSVQLDPMLVELRTTTCERWNDDCSVSQRGALEVTLGDMSVAVFDGHIAELGSTPRYRILVDHAVREDCYNIEGQCEPSYATWGVNALFIRA